MDKTIATSPTWTDMVTIVIFGLSPALTNQRTARTPQVQPDQGSSP